MKSISRLTFFLLLTLQLFNYDLQISQAAPQNSGYSSASVAAKSYYVDSLNGSDANPGTSEDKAWQTLTPVHTIDFLPGDVIHFKRGSQWHGGLTIDNSGTEGIPIIITDYGNSEDPPPTFMNPGQIYGVRIGYSYYESANKIYVGADWVVLENIRVIDVKEAGVKIYPKSDHNVVRNIEVIDTGFGVEIEGQYNLVTHNHIHDLHMIKDTPGDKGTTTGNDDYGAVGIQIEDSYNEVSYNKIANCLDHSYDYGIDGGTVDIWVSQDVGRVTGTNIHHNWAIDNDGFLEAGGKNCEGCTIPIVENTIVAYNVAENKGNGFITVHLAGSGSYPYQVEMKNFRVENNTIIGIVSDSEDFGWTIFRLNDGTPLPGSFLVYNNIFYLHRMNRVSNISSFTHENNLYYLTGGTKLGYLLGPGEEIADPQFVNLAERDFHLQPSSPAINAGINLGYTLDFENNPVPTDLSPDLGAFEYQSMPEPTSTPLPTTSTPTTELTSTPLPPTTTPMPTAESPTPLPTVQPDTISLALDGPTSVAPNETFNMDVVARNIPDPGLYGVQFEINYDPNMVSVSNVQVNPNLTFVVENNVDNTIGKIKFAASQQGRIPGLTGDVVLLSFSATAANSSGQITFSFQDEKISDDQAQSLMAISHQYNISVEDNGAPPEPTTQPTLEPTPASTVMPSPTTTPEPTVYPTPEPTDEPTSMVISGKIILTGRNNDNWSDAIVSIENGGITSFTDVDGTFRMTDVPAELLGNITAEAPGYLSAVCNEITMVASSIALNPITLLSGDINNDNLVDIADATAVGTDFGQTGINSPADITRDNTIDIFDIVLVSVNFGEIGPTEWNCVTN